MADSTSYGSNRKLRPTSPALRPRFSWLTDRWMAVSFLTPTLVILLFITIFPLLWSLYLSFTEWSVIRDARTAPQWIGTANYLGSAHR